MRGFQVQLLLLQFFLMTVKAIDNFYTYTLLDPQSSYIEYKQWDATESGEFKFRFKTHKPNGLLLYSDNSRVLAAEESYIVLKLLYGRLVFTVQMGSEDYRSQKKGTLGKNLADLKWHDIVITRNRRVTTLNLDGKETLILVNEGEQDKLILNSGVFVGGLSKGVVDVMIDRTVLTLARFAGCISNVRFKSGESTRYFRWLITANEVTPGCANACTKFHCMNGGTCVNHFVSALCNCDGTGFEGVNCTTPAPVVHLQRRSYVAVNVAGPMKATSSHVIKFRFRTHQSSGVIIAAASGKDHLMFELFYGTIRFTIDLGGGFKLLQIGDVNFSDHRWHLVEIIREKRSVRMTIDKRYTANETTPGLFSNFDLDDLLFIGGKPSTLFIKSAKSETNFTGCLQQVYYNGVDVINNLVKGNSARYQIYGSSSETCPEERTIGGLPRNDEGFKTGSKIDHSNTITTGTAASNSNEDNHSEAGIEEKPVDAMEGLPSSTKVIKKSKTLSKKTVVWLIVGIIIGTIVLAVAIFCLIYLKHRYTGVSMSSTARESTKYSNGHMHSHVMYRSQRGLGSITAERV